MGRKYLKEIRYFVLGIREIKVEFMAPEIYPLTLDSLATASKSGDIRWKKCMYNSTPHSLGPGILSLAHARRTL